MPDNAEEASLLLTELKSTWITQETAAVIFEKTIHNRNSDSVSTIEALFEFPPAGFVRPSSRVSTMPMDAYKDLYGAIWVVMILSIMFLIAELYQVSFFQCFPLTICR